MRSDTTLNVNHHSSTSSPSNNGVSVSGWLQTFCSYTFAGTYYLFKKTHNNIILSNYSDLFGFIHKHTICVQYNRSNLISEVQIIIRCVQTLIRTYIKLRITRSTMDLLEVEIH